MKINCILSAAVSRLSLKTDQPNNTSLYLTLWELVGLWGTHPPHPAPSNLQPSFLVSILPCEVLADSRPWSGQGIREYPVLQLREYFRGRHLAGENDLSPFVSIDCWRLNCSP
ncbi:hypothetical protein ElyMa_005629500 [Elysia marginata]|uniref:Uncharacterized protein n=1 Tax=Elysia marginata TaxID=1093978 RepID=A0AAV4F7N8_9GAST|nr:hypothetical protein ElyMa_005629500 [Elysia marginata]